MKWAIGMALLLGGCSGVRTDPGSGTYDLLVRASVSFDSDETSASLRARVERAGQDVDAATVRMWSGLGGVVLSSMGKGEYRGAQVGYAPDGYGLEVTLLDAQGRLQSALRAAVEAPVAGVLRAPDLTRPLDARALEGGLFEVRWEGPAADEAKLKFGDYDSGDLRPDPLRAILPAMALKDTEVDVELERTNSTPLAGGVTGSTLSVTHSLKSRAAVVNPF
jgi:hypothetical protein